MKRSIVVSLLIIVLAVAALGGGTLAWFTASAEIKDNVFTAGTLEIGAGESWDEDFKVENWNPGDCTEKKVELAVKGSKRAFIRVLITEKWSFPKEEGSPEVVTTYERDAANVSWSVGEVSWPGEPAEWQMMITEDGTYWYYKGMFDPDQSEEGGRTPDGPEKVTVLSKVCLAGADTDNEYQGATYTLGMNFEAIQVTNEAVNDAWGVYWDSTQNKWVEVEDENGED